MTSAVKFADKSPFPAPSALYTHVMLGGIRNPCAVLSRSSEPGHAGGDASRLADFSDRRGVGYYQGAFKVSKGFVEKFGSQRVVDTPITEAGFTGLAIGAAMAGLHPIVELMTMNFGILAMDQIVNNAAKIHYMSGGQMSVSMVIRGPGSAAHQLGAQHSQSLEAWFCHVPGFKVIAPSTPHDAKGF